MLAKPPAGRLHVWLRGAFTLNADLSGIRLNDGLDPVVAACRLVTYHIVKHGLSTISYSTWYHIAVKKMQMLPEAAFALFSAASVNDPGCSRSRFAPSHRFHSPSKDSSGEDDVAISLSALALTVALHGAAQFTSIMAAPKDVWPSEARGNRRIESVAGHCVTNFVQSRFEEILGLLILCDADNRLVANARAGVVVAVPPNWQLTHSALLLCDLLFEGAYLQVDVEDMPVIPSPISELIPRRFQPDKTCPLQLRFDVFVRVLRTALQDDPFDIHDIRVGAFLTIPSRPASAQDTARYAAARRQSPRLSNLAVKRVSPNVPPPHKLCQLRAWSHMQLLVDVATYRGVHMRIADGHQPVSLVLAPLMMQTAVIENCNGCGAILLGPVADTTVLRYLNAISVSVITNRLVIEHCRNLVVFTQTRINPLIVGGDCEKILFAPYNLSYDGLENELKHARMRLASPEENLWNRPLQVAKLFNESELKRSPKSRGGENACSARGTISRACWSLMPPGDFFLHPLPLLDTNKQWKAAFVDASPEGYAKAFCQRELEAERRLAGMTRDHLDSFESIFEETLSRFVTDTDRLVLARSIAAKRSARYPRNGP